MYHRASVKIENTTRTHVMKILCALGTAVFLLLAARPGFGATDVIVGGTETKTRVVIYLGDNDTISPELEAKDLTLSVKFPYRVAQPRTISDRFLIDTLVFDGTRATITMKKPFAHTWQLKQVPSRLVIDIADRSGGRTATPCALKRVESSLRNDRATVSLVLADNASAQARSSSGNKVVVHLEGSPPCPDMGRLFEKSPLVELAGVVRMQEGTACILSVHEPYRLKRARRDDLRGAVVLELAPSKTASKRTMEDLGLKLLEAGDYASAISILEPVSPSLGFSGLTTLARAYWAASYPYAKGETASKAFSIMDRAVTAAAAGPEAEAAALEYCSWLVASGRTKDASRMLGGLEGSSDPAVRIHAMILAMAALNRDGSYDDAYALSHKLSSHKDMPERLKGLFLATLADTLLGLKDFARAHDQYLRALAMDPGSARSDPGVFGRMGEAALKMNDFASARVHLTDAVNLAAASDRHRFLVMLGDAFYELGEKDRSAAAFLQAEQAASTTGELSLAMLKRARIVAEKHTDERGRLSDKGYNEVMDIYASIEENLRKDKPDDALLRLVKVREAQAYARHQEIDRALATYLEVWKGGKRDDDLGRYARAEAMRIIIEQCRIYHRDNRYDKTLELYLRFKDSFVKDLADGPTLFVMGESLYRAGRLDEARDILERSTRTESLYKEQAFSLLFFIDYKRERYQEALLWNTLCLGTFPKGKEATLMRRWRGFALVKTGNMDAAIPFLEEATSPDDPFALSALDTLAQVYGAKGDFQRQQGALDRIVAFHPARVSPVIERALYSRAEAKMRSGDLQGAKVLYETLLEAYPRSPRAHWAMYSLARVQLAEGDTEGAKERLETVKRVSRDPVLVQAARTAIDEVDLENDLRLLKASGSLVRKTGE